MSCHIILGTRGYVLAADLSAMLMRQGMMTAGDTAASTNPSISPTVRGKPMMKWERPATAAASTKQGMKVALDTTIIIIIIIIMTTMTLT